MVVAEPGDTLAAWGGSVLAALDGATWRCPEPVPVKAVAAWSTGAGVVLAPDNAAATHREMWLLDPERGQRRATSTCCR